MGLVETKLKRQERFVVPYHRDVPAFWKSQMMPSGFWLFAALESHCFIPACRPFPGIEHNVLAASHPPSNQEKSSEPLWPCVTKARGRGGCAVSMPRMLMERHNATVLPSQSTVINFSVETGNSSPRRERQRAAVKSFVTLWKLTNPIHFISPLTHIISINNLFVVERVFLV